MTATKIASSTVDGTSSEGVVANRSCPKRVTRWLIGILFGEETNRNALTASKSLDSCTFICVRTPDAEGLSPNSGLSTRREIDNAIVELEGPLFRKFWRMTFLPIKLSTLYNKVYF